MKKVFSLLLLILLVEFRAGADEAKGELFFIDTDWKLKIDVEGFVLEKNIFDENNNYLEIFATNDKSGLVLSVFFEKAHGQDSSISCREYYVKNMNRMTTRSKETRYEKNGFAVYEYTIEEFNGITLNQRHFNLYASVKGTWIDVHVSKVNFQESDRKLIDDFISRLAIIDKNSYDFYLYGSYYFNNRKYPLAAKYYERALKLENEKRSLGRDEYYVLIDSLGMAYGISGDYQNSERVLLFGITVDPEYPMFHYNLACLYAEKGDTEKFLAHLEKSFMFRGNIIKGEKFPDPVKDSSFRNYLDDERFRALVKKYGISGT